MKKNQVVSLLRRGCEIEVCSEEDGFEGAWYKAILEDSPDKSGKKKLKVRYVALQADDGSTLRETTYRRFIRPIPPEKLFSTADFEEGSVVEAAQRDGWWTGVFVKKIDGDKHLVYYDSPPDLICYTRKQLRLHFDWTRGEWVRPQHKQLINHKSGFGCGTMVEVMEKTDGDVVWVPAIIVKEMEDGNSFTVKSCKYLSWNDEVKPTRSVSSCNIRPIPPPWSVENYELLEPVEVFTDPGWRPGIVVNILSDKQYAVCLRAIKKSLVFKHSDLRPSKESIIKRSMRNSTKVNAAITPQRSPSPVEICKAAIPEGETVTVPTREPSLAQGSRNEMADAVRNAGTLDITATLTKQKHDKAQGKTSREKTLEPMRNQNGLGNDSTQENEGSEDNNRKRKREQNLSSTANVEETRANETTMTLPFEKKLLIWNKFESLDVFKTIPQSPHFSPLVETEEDSRETSAVGMMYTYSALLEEVKDLRCSSLVSTLKGLKDSFAVLEKHGFDVKAPQSRIQKLLSLKDRQAKKTEELKGAGEEIAEKAREKVENKRKILELQRLNEEADKELAQMKSCAETIEQELEDVELQFQTTASAPW